MNYLILHYVSMHSLTASVPNPTYHLMPYEIVNLVNVYVYNLSFDPPLDYPFLHSNILYPNHPYLFSVLYDLLHL